jgi:hypothetical protein
MASRPLKNRSPGSGVRSPAHAWHAEDRGGYSAVVSAFRWPGTVAVTALALLTGCGAPPTAAEDAASRFTSAVDRADWSQACRLLTPRTRSELEQSAGGACVETLADEQLPRAGAMRGSSRFGTMAQVRFHGDTLFVARFGAAWRVTAAGCKKVSGHPYDCTLEG